MEGLVKTPIAARMVGLSPSWLFRNAPRLPGAHRAGRALRWDVKELKRWMAEQATQEHAHNGVSLAVTR